MRRVFGLITLLCVVGVPWPRHLEAQDRQDGGPIVCNSGEELVITDRVIHSVEDGIVAHGNCEVRIIDSRVEADGVAVLALRSSEVEIIDSYLSGLEAAVVAGGAATVE